jgi:phytoene synthase
MSQNEKRAREVTQWQVLAFRARSFRWASALLSRAHRRKVAALYAFCRAVDDLADADWVTPEAQADLDRLLAALEAEPHGEALWPPNYIWFRELCLECSIDFRVVRELLLGMLSDLGVVRVQTDGELVRYCYRAAGTVGLMMCSVLGVHDLRALRHAIDLGIAMQLTNIARDVLEDAEASRVYLPAERLAAYGVAPQALVDGEADEQAVSVVVTDVLDLAERYYDSGDAGMRYLPARARWAILVASRLYRGIGRRLRRDQQSNPLVGRTVVPWFEKLGLVAAATWSWFRVTIFPPATRPMLPYRDYPLGIPGTRRRTVVDTTRVPSSLAPADSEQTAGTGSVAVVSGSAHAVGHSH